MKPISANLSRFDFIKTSIVGAVAFFIPTSEAISQQDKPEKPAPLPLETVKEFVGVCHSNLDRVKEMLENNHLLLHASYDWGGGDFESGIEAAGHVGNKSIASYLLSQGARYNIYLASMLGQLDIIKRVLTNNPELLNSKGPHGFTLLHHAQKGGLESASVVDYLKSLGAVESRIDFYTKK